MVLGKCVALQFGLCLVVLLLAGCGKAPPKDLKASEGDPLFALSTKDLSLKVKGVLVQADFVLSDFVALVGEPDKHTETSGVPALNVYDWHMGLQVAMVKPTGLLNGCGFNGMQTNAV